MRTGKFTNTWKLNNTPQKNQVKEKIKKEYLKISEMNKNENTTLQNLWNTAKTKL